MPALSLGQLFEGFILSRQAAGCHDNTLTTYHVAYQSLVAALPVEVLPDITAITEHHLLTWAATLQHYATATRDQRLAKVKTLFTWACDNGFIPTNPGLVLKRPKSDWQPDPLTADETERLLRAAGQGRNRVRNYAMCCLFLDTGVRNTEFCYLRRPDLNLKTGELRITETKGGQPRLVVIGKRTKEAMWKWLMLRGDVAGDWLFCTEAGTQFRRELVHRIVVRIGERAGLRDVYPHRLRHTFAVLYIKNRGDPYSLQKLLGHFDMTMTRQYVKLAEQDVVEIYRSPVDTLYERGR